MARSIRKEIEEARARLGLSKRAYAARVGVSRPTLYALLSGVRPRYETWLLFVAHGGCRRSVLKMEAM